MTGSTFSACTPGNIEMGAAAMRSGAAFASSASGRTGVETASEFAGAPPGAPRSSAGCSVVLAAATSKLGIKTISGALAAGVASTANNGCGAGVEWAMLSTAAAVCAGLGCSGIGDAGLDCSGLGGDAAAGVVGAELDAAAGCVCATALSAELAELGALSAGLVIGFGPIGPGSKLPGSKLISYSSGSDSSNSLGKLILGGQR